MNISHRLRANTLLLFINDFIIVLTRLINPFTPAGIALGMGVALLFNTNVRLKGSSYWLNGEEGDNCYIFLLLAIVAQLWLCLTFNFVARRSVGIFSWTLFAVFLIYACVAEWDLVHDFTRDTFFEPQ